MQKDPGLHGLGTESHALGNAGTKIWRKNTRVLVHYNLNKTITHELKHVILELDIGMEYWYMDIPNKWILVCVCEH